MNREEEELPRERKETNNNAAGAKRGIFHYLSWSHLIWSAIFTAMAYGAFKCANRIDEWGWPHDFSYAFGGLCIFFITVASIYLILFQKHSFGSSPEDKFDIVDDRDKDYEERQRKIREKYKNRTE